MQNWSADELAAVKGYVQLATAYMNADSRAEYGMNEIEEHTLDGLLRYIDRAAEDLTADEARSRYLQGGNNC